MLCLTSPRNLLRVPPSIGLFVGSFRFVMLAAEPVLAVVSPAPADDRFGWTRGDADSRYVGWTSFQDELGTGTVGDPNPVIFLIRPLTVRPWDRVASSGRPDQLARSSPVAGVSIRL